MPLYIEYLGPKRPPKRSLNNCFLNESNSECPHRPNARQLPLTPPTPDYPLDNVPPTPPEPPRFSKRAREHVDPASDPAPKKRRVEDWLTKVPKTPPTRASSCPPLLDASAPHVTSDPGEGQRPLLEVLQAMS
jgi:hypothetical protein